MIIIENTCKRIPVQALCLSPLSRAEGPNVRKRTWHGRPENKVKFQAKANACHTQQGFETKGLYGLFKFWIVERILTLSYVFRPFAMQLNI